MKNHKYKCDSQKAKECIDNLKDAIMIKNEREQIQSICDNIFKIDNYFDRVYNNLKFEKKWSDKLWHEKKQLEDQLEETKAEKKYAISDKTRLLFWINSLYHALIKDNKTDKKTQSLIKEIKTEIKDYVCNDTYYKHCFWHDESDKDKEYTNYVEVE